MSAGSNAECWIEPRTRLAYPMAFAKYRRTREGEEKWPARHRALDPEVDRYAWRAWLRPVTSDLDVVLIFRRGVSPRIQRMVTEVLRDIGRGSSAAKAIRRVGRRFGLRQGQTRAFISGGIGFELRARSAAD